MKSALCAEHVGRKPLSLRSRQSQEKKVRVARGLGEGSPSSAAAIFRAGPANGYIIPPIRQAFPRGWYLPSGALAGAAQPKHRLPRQYLTSSRAEGDAGVRVPREMSRPGPSQRTIDEERMARH